MEFTVDDRVVYAYTGTRPLVPEQNTVVFIHGAAMDHSVWVLQSRYFAFHGRNVLAVDLPGHGRSAGPALASIGAMADWLVALLDAAGVKTAALVGHSMGSLVALEAAARYPERVQALALLGCAFPMAVAKPLLETAQADDPAAIEMIVAWGHGPAAQLGGNRAPGLWMTGGGRRLLEKALPGVLYNDLKACNDYQDGLASAAQVRCPTLLVLGKRDLMTPPRAVQGLLDVMKNARLVLLENCGHMLFYEQPDETLDALLGWVPS
jgi:pimeloyl-ACP methyl ester carboxylesterase